jgi:heterodisulfide reductase subunit A-like polyferredoxin
VHRGPTVLAHLCTQSTPMQGAPKLKVAIVGGGLAGLSTAVELLDQG